MKIAPSVITEKSRENTSLYRALKRYILDNKYTIVMVEEVIDFYWLGMVFVFKITNMTAFPLEYGREKSVE